MSSIYGSNLLDTYKNGSVTINKIFCSKTLDLKSVGYLEHGSSLSDHIPTWVNITKSSTIRLKAILKATFLTRRLNANDSRTVNESIYWCKEDKQTKLTSKEPLIKQI